VLAVCGTCNETIDLTSTRQTVAGGCVIISCLSCLGESGTDSDVAARFDVSDTHRADTSSSWLDATLAPHNVAPAAPLVERERMASNAIEVVDASAADDVEETADDVREDPTAPSRPLTALESITPPPVFRMKHLAVAGAVGAVVGAIVLFAPGDSSSPSASTLASINTPMPTEQLSVMEQAVPDSKLAAITSAMDPSEAVKYRDAIRERKRTKELARKKRGKRSVLKGRRFGRFSLGALPVSIQGQSWIHPLPGIAKPVSSHFGRFGARRGHRYRPSCGRGHCGYDLVAPWNMPIVSVLPGVVERVVWRSRRPSGRYVIIKHAEGLRTWYMHLHRPRHGLRPGMTVRAGEEIGRLGTTGLIQRVPHLHFSLEKAGKFYVDPAPFLAQSTTIAKPRPAAVQAKSRM